jgi:hypothetical protein
MFIDNPDVDNILDSVSEELVKYLINKNEAANVIFSKKASTL